MEQQTQFLQEICNHLDNISSQLSEIQKSNEEILGQLENIQDAPEYSLYDVCELLKDLRGRNDFIYDMSDIYKALKELQGYGSNGTISDVYDAVTDLADTVKYR